MDTNEILDKMVELCDAIISTHDAVESKRGDYMGDVCIRVQKWYSEFKYRYAKVLDRIRIIASVDGVDWYNAVSWKIAFKRGDSEINIYSHGSCPISNEPNVCWFKGGFTKGLCNFYYPLNNSVNMSQAKMFNEFLSLVDFDTIDKYFAVKLADLTKRLSVRDTMTLSEIK